jgi:Domain of unknown function (DUF4326)
MTQEEDDGFNCIPFEINEELGGTNIVTRYVLDASTRNVVIELNHQYKNKRINMCVTDYPNLPKFREALKRHAIKEKEIEEKHARLLAEVIDDNADMLNGAYFNDEYKQRQNHNKKVTKMSTFDDGNGGNGNISSSNSSSNSSKAEQENNNQKQEEKKRTFTAFKYSNDGKMELHESVIIANFPKFLYYDSQNHVMKYADVIDEGTRIITPCHKESYPYTPYEFADMNEVNAYVERARNENIDSLHSQAKQIAADYCDQKDEKVELLAMDIVSSYAQDKLPTTHYDIVLGGNGSGKSSYSGTFTAVGYRVVNLTNPNAANINRILGPLEIGQCTLVSDETGAIDKNPDLMAILKTGYATYMCKVSKINDFSREPEYFYTYCFKMIVSERMPNLRDARGVFDRSFVFTTYKGRPKYDIKETLTPQGIKSRLYQLNRLNDFRKLMLVYRLIHFKDPLQDIRVGVEGREKELSKPIIQLYYGTKIQPKIEATLQKFLDLRAEKKGITLEPILYPIVMKLVGETRKKDESQLLVFVKDIWDEIQIAIAGRLDERKPNEYHTLDYGTIYNNTISSILENTFGGRPKHTMYGNAYIFDINELTRVGRAYSNTSPTIQTKISTDGDDSDDVPEDVKEDVIEEISWNNQIEKSYEGSENHEGHEGIGNRPPTSTADTVITNTTENNNDCEGNERNETTEMSWKNNIEQSYEGMKAPSPLGKAPPIITAENNNFESNDLTSEKDTRIVHCLREPYDVYIGRESPKYGKTQSKWGNPYIEGTDGTREEVISKHTAWLLSDEEIKHEGFPFSNRELMAQVHELRGKTLGCYCSPKQCHGDILVTLADNYNHENNYFEGVKKGVLSLEPSEPSCLHTILTNEGIRRLLHNNTYWSGSKHYCKNCKYSDDRFGMINHLRLKHGNDVDNNNDNDMASELRIAKRQSVC